jgi:hypothetical protein
VQRKMLETLIKRTDNMVFSPIKLLKRILTELIKQNLLRNSNDI